MSLENLIKNIHEGDYVAAKADFVSEINERVSLKIEEKRASILESDDEKDEDDDEDEKDEGDKKAKDEDED
jgi:hypothetical protein